MPFGTCGCEIILLFAHRTESAPETLREQGQGVVKRPDRRPVGPCTSILRTTHTKSFCTGPTTCMTMRDFKKDSAPALARFGRDKRTRTTADTSEQRSDRRTRHEASDRDGKPATAPRKRASFNPHFTADNRPIGEQRSSRSEERDGRDNERNMRPNHEYRTNTRAKKPFGRNDSGEERRGSRPQEGFDRPRGTHRSPERNNDRTAQRGNNRYARENDNRGTSGQGDRRYSAGRASHTGSYREGGRGKGKTTDYPRYNPNKQTGEMRLNRFIAQSGICSRREADDFILAGLVSVNGVIVTELGTKVKPTDEVKFNDSRVQGEKKVYLVLNKPKGYVTTLDDPHATKTVMDLVQGACTERIYPVGRLDKNSVGLLLFTNDGDLTRQLTHPSYKKKKIYQVTLDRPLERADMTTIAEGITLEDGEIYADEIAYASEDHKEIGIEIHSGRNRIVRRIFEHLGYEVKKLDRVYYAGLTKKNLKRGAWRFLTREEVERLKSGQYE